MHKNHYWLQEEINDTLLDACYGGKLSDVRHLLLSQELPHRAQINQAKCVFRTTEAANSIFITPLSQACSQGHTEVVNYLLTAPELTLKAQPEQLDFLAYRNAVRQGQLGVIDYFIQQKDQNWSVYTHPDMLSYKSIPGSHEVLTYLLQLSTALPPRTAVLDMFARICQLNLATSVLLIDTFDIRLNEPIVAKLFQHLTHRNYKSQKILNLPNLTSLSPKEELRAKLAPYIQNLSSFGLQEALFDYLQRRPIEKEKNLLEQQLGTPTIVQHTHPRSGETQKATISRAPKI